MISKSVWVYLNQKVQFLDLLSMAMKNPKIIKTKTWSMMKSISSKLITIGAMNEDLHQIFIIYRRVESNLQENLPMNGKICFTEVLIHIFDRC